MENNIINPSNELMAGKKRNLPRDVFLHLFAIVTLYWSAISVIILCWQYVNYFFPDVLYYGSYDNGAIRFAVSSLVIVFPLFILTSWILNKIYAKESVVRESKIRKWLIYLTLFIMALVIIGDLIFVINTFLGGEISIRFALKAFSIIAVAGIIFGYYLDDVRRDTAWILGKYVAVISSLIILGLVIGAFFVVGSPMKARAEQFDQQRISDLSGIQSQVVNYWQRKGVLPNTLADLNDSISGYVAPNDPKNQLLSYEYIIKDSTSLSFQLCANFDLDSNTNNSKSAPIPVMYPDQMSQNWNHSAGRVCFDRAIDSQLYPPLNKGK